MTLKQAQTTKDFFGLKDDERFKALLAYLVTKRPRARSADPSGMIQESGKMDAYFEFFDQIDSAFRPAAEQPKEQFFPAYSDKPYPEGNLSQF